MSALQVTIDGEPMADDEARALWKRFSAYMDEHRGDLEGFAKSEGYLSAHPENRDGSAVLVLSRVRAQQPYGATPKPADRGSTRGSGGSRGRGPTSGAGGGGARKRARN